MKRNEAIEEQKVGDKTVIFDTDSFKFYELNETMGFIWDLLKSEVSRQDITERLVKEFDVDSKRAETDVERALESLREMNLLSERKR